LVALLFVGGVINLLWWIAVLTIFVLLEKIIPTGRMISRVAGGVFVASGGWLLAASLI
jgi:predicted metal-binding membrane protein